MAESAIAALGTAQAALDELDRRCCDIGRSPRLDALAAKLSEIRLTVLDPGGADPGSVSALLRETGAMVRALRIECCAPNRLPLYATLLDQLDVVQRDLVPTQ